MEEHKSKVIFRQKTEPWWDQAKPKVLQNLNLKLFFELISQEILLSIENMYYCSLKHKTALCTYTKHIFFCSFVCCIHSWLSLLSQVCFDIEFLDLYSDDIFIKVTEYKEGSEFIVFSATSTLKSQNRLITKTAGICLIRFFCHKWVSQINSKTSGGATLNQWKLQQEISLLTSFL